MRRIKAYTVNLIVCRYRTMLNGITKTGKIQFICYMNGACTLNNLQTKKKKITAFALFVHRIKISTTLSCFGKISLKFSRLCAFLAFQMTR